METNTLTLLLAIVSGIVTLGTAYLTYRKAKISAANSASALVTAQLAQGRANTAVDIAQKTASLLK